MTPSKLRMVFASVYLLVDFVYVLSSRSYYENYAKKIQGTGFPSSRFLGAIVAYIALVIGWWFFATSFAEKLANQMNPTLAGALSGALYGFVVYGVFNGTMYVMFNAYDHRIALRDLLWGIVSATIITTTYTTILAKKK